jgi:tetratricopeptide (TPR) repeat protein
MDKGDSYLARGIDKFNQEEYKLAINLFNYSLTNLLKEIETLEKKKNEKEITEKRNKLSQAFFYRGLAYKEEEKWDKSIKDLSVCINIKPNFNKAYAERAVSFYNLGFPKRAIEDLSEALKLDPYNPTYLYNRANVYLELDLLDKCIIDSSRSISIDNTLPHSYFTRAEAYKRMGDYNKAIKDYKIAIKLFSINDYIYEAYLSLGKCYYGLSMLKEAEKVFQTAFLYEENPITAYFNLAILYGDNQDNDFGSVDKAIKYATKAANLSNFKNPGIMVYLSSLYYKKQNYDKAYKLQKLALSLKPGDEEIAEWLEIYKYKAEKTK